jgi:hypothetical protein
MDITPPPPSLPAWSLRDQGLRVKRPGTAFGASAK